MMKKYAHSGIREAEIPPASRNAAASSQFPVYEEVVSTLYRSLLSRFLLVSLTLER